MYEFPEAFTAQALMLWVMEGFFLFDIVLNFFKQELDESGNSKYEPLEEVAYKYFSNKFSIDVLAFLPIGWLMAVAIDSRLKFFWVLKAIRIGQMNYYLRDRMLIPVINSYIEMK